MQVGFLWPVGAVEAGPIVIKILPFASEAVDLGRSRVEMAGKQLLLLAHCKTSALMLLEFLA